ncbi:hypothetical protein N9C68_02945 [Gammaproteobacteria bacterium]|nr:hypothetical protein [Gammaproteobacteria bacterium]
MYKNIVLKIRNKLLNILFGLNFQPRHWVHTVKCSLDDAGMPSRRLMDLTKEAYDFGVHFEQKLADLSNREVFQEHKDVFQEPELIFIDGPKNEVFEYKLVEYFKELSFDNIPIIFFDDINQIEMLNLWRDIEKPKFDITSLGQFTGTGLIDWVK